MNLKQKVLNLLDVYYSDKESDKEIQADLMRRGKLDTKKQIEIMFMLIKEVDELSEAVELLSKKQVVKKVKK